MQRFTAVAACGLFVSVSALASAEVVFFDFLLGGDQEVPANATDAFGFATLAYDTDFRTFDLQLFTTGIALSDLLGVGPNASPLHIHAGAPGQNGPIVIDLGLAGDFTDEGDGVLSFLAFGVDIGGPAAGDPLVNEQLLFGGGLYLNLHTVAFPGGEIRGQIVPSVSGLAVMGLAGFVNARRRPRLAA